MDFTILYKYIYAIYDSIQVYFGVVRWCINIFMDYMIVYKCIYMLYANM